MVRVLLMAKADVNARSKHSVVPIHLAAKYGHNEMVKILIEAGADLNVQELKSGRSALIEAVLEGHLSVVETLVEEGANLELRGEDGLTVTLMASANNKLSLVKMFKNVGADL